ncbi:MAG: glutaminase A [Acidobacteriota bacterium]|nr:glutaminase A [Blastocatellia bacterium]MDW8413333.1 glutaminase A [Acidobacteriota bacterium]
MYEELQKTLEELHARYLGLTEGKVASYIPELSKADPNWFGIVVVTTDGQVYGVGDRNKYFTIQSISKPFVYGLALEDHGREFVSSKVGVEPSGEAFNAITLDERSKRPHNPMINAGAIALTSIIKGEEASERLNRVLDMFSRYVGTEVYVNMPVFLSERATGHRNRAIAYLMRNFNMIGPDIEATLDLYFQQCAIMMNCTQMAIMAATLANAGVNPLTGVRAIERTYVRDVLSVMYTCGLYDFAGEWACNVGLPAKSGVGGGILAVVPRRMGIGVFSPPLDEHGHSVRGIKVCEELSRRFRLHIFDLLMDA